MLGLGGNQGDDTPAAYLNYIFFDETDGYSEATQDDDSGWLAVPSGAYNNQTMLKFSSPIVINKPGYIYIYLSYENVSDKFVYFDDFKVNYTKSQIVQSNNYYAFGLQTSQSWTRIDTKPNQYLYNGGAELNEVTGNYDLFFRGYDPVLGRMNGVDPEADFYASQTPYNYGFNDPVYWNDPMGDDPASSERGGYSWASMGGCGCWRDEGPLDAHAGPGSSGGMYGASWNYYTYGSSSIGGSAFAKINVDVHLNESYYNAMYAAAEQARNGSAEDVANYASAFGGELLWGFGQMPNLQTGEDFTGNIYLYLYDGESGSSSTNLYWQAPYKPSVYDLAPDSWIPVYGDVQRSSYWFGQGDISRGVLYGASAALDVAGIAGIARAAVKTGARLLVRQAVKTELHHSFPKFLGGAANQRLTKMTFEQHRALHKDLNAFLRNITDDVGNHMRPQRGNPGSLIQRNFSSGQRIDAMSNFYNGSGSKYSKAASDFFSQIGRN